MRIELEAYFRNEPGHPVTVYYEAAAVDPNTRHAIIAKGSTPGVALLGLSEKLDAYAAEKSD